MSLFVIKALHHIKGAIYYFEYFATENKQNSKSQIGGYINKLHFIIDDILSKLSDPGVRDEFRTQIKNADSVGFESINDKLLYLNDVQRDVIENLLSAMINVEEINFVPETILNKNDA